MQNEITWRRLFNSIYQYKIELIRANTMIILMSILILPIPMIIPYALEILYTPDTNPKASVLSENFDFMLQLDLPVLVTVFFFTIVLLRAVVVTLNKCQYSVFAELSSKIGYAIRKHLLGQIDTLQLHEIRQLDGRHLATKLLLDVDVISNFLCNFLGRILVSVITIMLSMIVLLNIHTLLALSILFLYPIVIVYWTKIAMQFTTIKNQEKQSQERFSATSTEVFCQIDTVRTTASSQWQFNKLIEHADELRQKSSWSLSYSHNAIQNSSIMLHLGIDVFQFIVILISLSSALSLGEVLTIYAYLWLIQNPILEIIQLKNAFYSSKSSLQRINEIYDASTEPATTLATPKIETSELIDIDLNNVSFSYNSNLPVLANTTLNIKAKEFIGISGPSGEGKSTLAQLLVGLYYPDSGEINYCGESINNIGAEYLRKYVVLVLQDTYTFDYSLRENLTTDNNLSDMEIVDMLNLCQLGEFFNTLKDGLETIIGTKGISLSGGQKQRLGIARALLMNPKVLILDETTSALDFLTEEKLFSAIMPMLRQRTIIMISHRKETLALADKIYKLERGNLTLTSNSTLSKGI